MQMTFTPRVWNLVDYNRYVVSPEGGYLFVALDHAGEKVAVLNSDTTHMLVRFDCGLVIWVDRADLSA